MEDLTTLQDLYSEASPYITVPANGVSSVPADLFLQKMILPPPEKFPSVADIGSALTDFGGVLKSAVSYPVTAVTGTVRNAYLYLIGGIVVIGILAIFVLGAGTKFAGKIGALK